MGKSFRRDAKNEKWRKEKQRRQDKHKHSAFESRANFYIDKRDTYGDQEA